MIAKLEFDCSIPEEAEKMKRALLADDLCSVILGMLNFFRNRGKGNGYFKEGGEESLATEIVFNGLLEANGINLDNIYS